MREEISITAPHWSADAERWVFDDSRTRPKQQSSDHLAQYVYSQVWRFDFTAPGFCLLDISPGVDSHTLRSLMVSLKDSLSEINVKRAREPFVFRSMGRFDQQETTKFHLDGAPDQSLLILGYEPSNVRSQVFLADYTRAAFVLGITPKQFLEDFNPMYRAGEDKLVPYITELPQPDTGHSRILFINNSSLPFTENRTNPLGVMHKAVIAKPDEAESRLVNSAMTTVGEKEQSSLDQQREFVATETISGKFY